MRRLSRYEEIQYIKKAVQANDYIGQGSSRAVYGIDDKLVIKVASDRGGRTQNHQEIEFFKHHPHLCMTIYAYGANILVCERSIECFDVDRMYDYLGNVDTFDDLTLEQIEDSVLGEFLEEYPDKSFKDLSLQAQDIIEEATEYIGVTADNLQVGYGADSGCVKLYDFGFIPNEEGCDSKYTQIGCIDYYLCKCGTFGFLKTLSLCLNRNSNGYAFQKLISKLRDQECCFYYEELKSIKLYEDKYDKEFLINS